MSSSSTDAGYKPPTPRPSRGRRSYTRVGLSHDQRDLAAVLAYGSPNLPWTNAWTDNRIEQVRNFKFWTYIAVNTIAKKLSTQIPNLSYVRTEDHYGDNKKRPPKTAHTSRNFVPQHVRNKALLPLQSHEQLEPVPSNHPMLRLLKCPNDDDTTFDLLYETLMYLFLTGNAYWWIPKGEGLSGKVPVALWCLPSHWVWPILGTEGRFITSWEIRPVEGNYLRRQFPADEIVHFRFKNPISKIDGYSPLTAGAQWGDVMDQINRAKWNSYRQGTFPTLAIQFDGKLQDPTDEQLRRIEAKYYERHVGETRANRPLFLPPGVTVKPLTITPNQMVFGETEEATRDNILALYGVPAAVINSHDATYGGNLAAQASFCYNCLNPLCTFLGQTITEKVVWLFDSELRCWWEDLSPEDPELLEKRLATDLMYGARTRNEVRLIRGLQPFADPAFDVPMTPTTMQLPFGGNDRSDPTDSDIRTPATTPALPREPDDNKKSASTAPSLNNIIYG